MNFIHDVLIRVFFPTEKEACYFGTPTPSYEFDLPQLHKVEESDKEESKPTLKKTPYKPVKFCL